MSPWEGDDYQSKFDRLAAEGQDVHGEADFVCDYRPVGDAPFRVLDAGCGTGRVAIELARRGVDVVGVDLEEGMLTTARNRAPDLAWIRADLAELDLRDDNGVPRLFDLVVMAGNVMLFAEDRPGTVAGCARHVAPGGRLVAGFQLGGVTTPSGHVLPPYELDPYDGACAAAGLTLTERFSTWNREPYTGGPYAVSVHQRA
jgi:SAM-dependent methyltransferase